MITSKLQSWYKPELGMKASQEEYCKFLSDGFQVDDAYGQPIPYDMTGYQIEFHSQSFNVLRAEAKDILFIKARGISFTFSSLIELIMTGVTFDNQIIPIISQRKESAKDTLNTCKRLIENCKVKEIINDAEFTETSEWIKFKSTGSVIKIYPSASAADAIRGRRLLRGLIDEFAFQTKDKELWAAVENCMQHGVGQMLIGSTPCGRQNMFFEFVNTAREKPEAIGMYLFDLPMFDPKKFNAKIPIHDQDVVPIAPWVNMNKLEIKRARDWRIFMQEQMCDFLDDSLSFISYAITQRCIQLNMPNFKENLKTNFAFKYTETDNPIYIGCDVAEKNDYFAITAFEEVTDEEGAVTYIQRYLDFFNGKRIPELEEYLTKVINAFPNVVKVRIDETGLGSGLVGYMKKQFGSLIEGINFASSVYIGESNDKAPIRKVMCTNLRRMMEDGQVVLLEDTTQVKHITSLDYSFKIPPNQGDGHGDILFAVCLALLKSKYRAQPNKVHVTRALSDDVKDVEKMDVMQRLNFYKRNGRKLF